MGYGMECYHGVADDYTSLARVVLLPFCDAFAQPLETYIKEKMLKSVHLKL